MKIIGLIGGMSWESTVPYYRQINEVTRERLGGLHSAGSSFTALTSTTSNGCSSPGTGSRQERLLAGVARAVEKAGADLLVLCTNTMHKVAPAIEAAVGIPLLHIADATGEEIKRAGFSTVGLLGTRFTMEQDFYKDRLRQDFGLRVLVPGEKDRQIVHRVIYDELCLGRVDDGSRAEFRSVMAELVSDGAEAIILGCTEITLLVGQEDAAVPLFDTTRIHARRAAEWALED